MYVGQEKDKRLAQQQERRSVKNSAISSKTLVHHDVCVCHRVRNYGHRLQISMQLCLHGANNAYLIVLPSYKVTSPLSFRLSSSKLSALGIVSWVRMWFVFERNLFHLIPTPPLLNKRSAEHWCAAWQGGHKNIIHLTTHSLSNNAQTMGGIRSSRSHKVLKSHCRRKLEKARCPNNVSCCTFAREVGTASNLLVQVVWAA